MRRERADAITTLGQVMESVTVGVVALDGEGRVIVANKPALDMLARAESTLIGSRAHDVLHCDVTESDGCSFDSAVRGSQAVEIEGDNFCTADGATLPVSWLSSPLMDRDGIAIVFRDDTVGRARAVVDAAEREQARADLAAARQSVADLEWRAELTQSLSSSLDDTEVLRRLARIVAGRLADVVIVDLLRAEGYLQRVGGAAAPGIDLDIEAILARDDVTHVVAPESPSSSTVLTGQVVRLTAEAIDNPDVLGPSSRVLLHALGARSVLVVPLGARERVVGALVLVRRHGSPVFDDADEIAALDVGRRAALAVDNGRLYRAQSEIALELQHALLPRPTSQVSVRVAVRYLPAHDQYDVGGDWYDLFRRPDGTDTTVMIIGDVAGHDLRAATTMAAIRNLLRGVVVATNYSCAEVIAAVDANLETLGVVGTASTIVMTAHPDGDDSWTLTWSNAGHLPPVLIGPDATVTLLDGVHGPILGTKIGLERQDNVLTVAAGSTIVLYTDGLVERRDEPIDSSLIRLKQVAMASSHLADSPAALIDELVRRNHTSPEDDTAILVCHLPAGERQAGS